MSTELSAEAFAAAFVAGNKVAQFQDTATSDVRGAYQIADALGYSRDSMEWDAAVAGAASFLINGRRF